MLYQGSQVHAVAAEVLAAAEAELDPPVGRACVVPGAQVAWDDCCDGQLAVAVTRTYLSDNFPIEYGAGGAVAGPCAPAWLVADLFVQVIRCTPTLDESGAPPDCQALDAAADQLAADGWAVRKGVSCRLGALADADQLVDWRVGVQQSLGPEGGCAGSQLQLLVCLDNACQCQDS
jgi:hypothetical protein